MTERRSRALNCAGSSCVCVPAYPTKGTQLCLVVGTGVGHEEVPMMAVDFALDARRLDVPWVSECFEWVRRLDCECLLLRTPHASLALA